MLAVKVGPIEFEAVMRANGFEREGGRWVREDKPGLTVRYALDGIHFEDAFTKTLVCTSEGLFGMLRTWGLIC